MALKQRTSNLLAILMAAVLVAVDQIIKIRVMDTLPKTGRLEVVRGLFYLTYVENRGAAFGIFQGKTMMLSVLTGIVLLGVLVFLLSGKSSGRFMAWSLALVMAGGVGNLIDRIFRGFVVDYLDFSALFGFPVFNFADCCVVVGTILLLCHIAWYDVSVGKKSANSSDPTESEV